MPAGDEVAALQAAFGDTSGGVWFAQSPLGGIVAELAGPGGARATVALQGAQVLSYVPAGGREVLWLSPVGRLGTGKALRGGIPVCWPWFGPHPTGPGLPAHGLVRAASWHVSGSLAGSGGAASVALAWRAPGGVPEGLARRELSARIEVTLADALEVALVTRNDGPRPVAITQALHTYLAVGDIGRVDVGGLDGRDYVDQIDANAMKRQSGTIGFAGEVDRIYTATTDSVTVDDPVLGRRLVVDKSGSLATVVWNPWIDKGRRLGDTGGDDGYRRFVCVETANAGPHRVSVAPGGEARLVARIRAVPLASG